MEILKLEQLTKSFGELKAVNDFSAAFKENTINAVIGPNGAGKSTLFNLVTGRLKTTSGKVYFMDQEITNHQPHELVKKGIGRSFQITNIFRGLSTFENIRLGIISYRENSFDLLHNVDNLENLEVEILEILETVGLQGQRDNLAGLLSHGDQKRLEIALTLTTHPKLLLLDEPTAGMDPDETRMLTQLIETVAQKNNITVILTEHDMEVVFSICKRILVMQYGSIIADGTEKEVKGDQRVREAYLGVEE